MRVIRTLTACSTTVSLITETFKAIHFINASPVAAGVALALVDLLRMKNMNFRSIIKI